AFCPLRRSFKSPARTTPHRTTVAVGTAVAGRPPRRSQRAGLPHWAPALGGGGESLLGPGMEDPRLREPSVSETPYPLPGQPVTLAATPKRLEPVPDDPFAEGAER